MSIYQALYETVNKELKELEEKLNELYKKRENIRNDLSETEEILWKHEDLLSKLATRKDYMPQRNQFKISVYVGMTAIASLIFGIIIYIYGLVKILLLFPNLNEGISILILFFLVFWDF